MRSICETYPNLYLFDTRIAEGPYFGAIWQPLWLKNSHDMAIFSHILTFSVTFLVAVTTFMHKTCTERTKTFLIHRTIDEYTFFAISKHLHRGSGVQKWPKWTIWTKM